MVLSRIACMGLVVLFAAEARADQTKDTRAEYEARKAKLGRGSNAQVDLALWCEAHGLSVERTKHLALAVLNDSNNTLARGLMGLVSYQGKWENPDKLRDKVQADETLSRKLAEYNARREALGARDRKALLANAEAAEKRGQLDVAERLRRRYVSMMAPEHVKLGLWCEQNGLKAEATAHFTQAVVLDPYDDATWKHLGYVKRDGRWISRAQAETERAEADRLRKAERYYEPLLRKYREALRGKDEARADEARALLAEITDPLALTSVWRVFGIEREADQLTVVEMLGRMESATATRRLAGLALYGKSITVREAATKALRGREPRDYASEVIEHIHAPMTYQVEPVQGPGSPGALLVETPRFKMLRTYDAPPAFSLSNQFFGYVGYDPNGLPVVARGVELQRMEKESPLKPRERPRRDRSPHFADDRRGQHQGCDISATVDRRHLRDRVGKRRGADDQPSGRAGSSHHAGRPPHAQGRRRERLADLVVRQARISLRPADASGLASECLTATRPAEGLQLLHGRHARAHARRP